MINVNIELFKRTTPVKKIEIIENLTQTELGRVTEETILKIVKETGRRRKGTRDYEFYINPDRRKGNNWNSVVEGLWLYKGKLSVMVYVQFDNTDTSLIVPFQYFFKKGDFRGTVKGMTTMGIHKPTTMCMMRKIGRRAFLSQSLP